MSNVNINRNAFWNAKLADSQRLAAMDKARDSAAINGWMQRFEIARAMNQLSSR